MNSYLRFADGLTLGWMCGIAFCIFLDVRRMKRESAYGTRQRG